MGFISIRTYQYRNLADSDIPVEGKDIYLVGENGQGKTNFIEAIYLLCYGASFRAKSDRQMIVHEQGEMSVIGKCLSSGEVNTIAVSVTDKEKRITLNGKQVRDRKDVIGNNPCILFSHDDMELAKGSPEKRRLFFNQTMTLADTLFIDTLRSYSRLLKMRNLSLKEKRNALLDVYDEQIAAVGFEMQEKRERAVADFNRTFSPLFGRISGLSDELIIRYVPSFRGVKDTAGALDELKSKREADIFSGQRQLVPTAIGLFFLWERGISRKLRPPARRGSPPSRSKSPREYFSEKRPGEIPSSFSMTYFSNWIGGSASSFYPTFPSTSRRFIPFFQTKKL
jgi:DNA replication and repair protein RecF